MDAPLIVLPFWDIGFFPIAIVVILSTSGSGINCIANAVIISTARIISGTITRTTRKAICVSNGRKVVVVGVIAVRFKMWLNKCTRAGFKVPILIPDVAVCLGTGNGRNH